MITIRPSRDAAFFDSVINTPELYAKISDDASAPCGQMTVAVQVANPSNIFLEVLVDDQRAGFFAFLQRAIGIYEVHTNLLPSCRGAMAVRAGHAARDWMFIRTDANLLTSFTWDTVPEANVYARAMGMQADYERPHARTVKGAPVRKTVFSISLHEWQRIAWSRFMKEGQKFHEQFFAGLGHDLHEEDANHDGMVGLVLTMAAIGNQAVKAELVYNRWAATHGWLPARFHFQRGDLLTVDINAAVIEIDRELTITIVERRKF